MNNKVVLITGATSGIGKSLSEFLVNKGYIVYGTSRRPQSSQKIETTTVSGERRLELLQCDVRDEEAVKRTVEYIVKKEGRIDILINNAGYSLSGAVEELQYEEVHEQFSTNFYGPQRMIRHVLPFMRSKSDGLIINISSVCGFISVPFQSMYSASKYALEAMSEALRIEVKPFGVKVVLVEPGDVKTGFTDSRTYSSASQISKVYFDRMTKAVNSMAKSEQGATGPEPVIKVVERVLKMKNPPVRITVGLSYKFVALLKRVLPSRVVEKVITMLY